MNPSIQLKATPSLLIALVLLGFALLPGARAVVPPPDGGYPNFTTAEGQKALFNLTTGSANTAVGWFSLFSNATGSFNTATGAGTLLFNTADANTAFGTAALLFNTGGINNTAVGAAALLHNTIAEENTATGAFALSSNTDGDFNTANGAFALQVNTTGERNTATGDSAMFSNTIGNQNTATGNAALGFNTTGGQNTANGDQALYHNTTGSYNTALGWLAGFNVATASNVICISAQVAGVDVSYTTWIGGVYGVATQSGTTAPVVVSVDGQLGTATSSERFKKDIATMEKASEVILSLRPVTFHYKTDTQGTPQFGLIAEEVAKVNPALVLPDKEGKPYTVRYDQVNAMLLNDFLKEHHTVQEQQATITKLALTVAQQKKDFQAAVAQLTARLDEQASQIQKVSAQLEASKPSPQVVNNNQ